MLLQLGGHTTALAHDGAEGLKMVQEFKPDIVLLDLGLPDMDGYEVARAIRRMTNLQQPVVAAVAGWGAPEDRLRTKQAGLDEHLTKPVVDISMIELIFDRLAWEGRSTRGDGPVTNGHRLDAPHS